MPSSWQSKRAYFIRPPSRRSRPKDKRRSPSWTFQRGAGLVAVLTPEFLVADRTEGAERLTAVDAKGLEFDGVVVADPEAIVRESPGAAGMARLYVALTRTTTRLTILAPTPPGPPLEDALGPFEPVPPR